MAGHGLHPQRGHRLPRLRRENQANQVNPARGDGQKIKKTLGGKSDETANSCNIIVTDDDVHAGSDSNGGRVGPRGTDR